MSSTATVQLLRLSVPERRPSVDGLRELQTAALQTWLNSLPLANTVEAAQQLLGVVRRGNRTVLGAPLRHSAIELLRPPVDALIETLKSRYLGAALPLAPRNRVHAVTVHELLEEMSYGYKILLIDLLNAPTRGAVEQQMLLNALPHAVDYLGQLVLGKYLLHEADPRATWGELHRLYHYAEQYVDPAEFVEYDGHKDRAQHRVTVAYLRIALLALANPYHLMPGEADTVYQELLAWSTHCELLKPRAGSNLAGKFLVDLAGSSAPYFNTSTRAAPADPRVIDLHGLVTALAQQIKNIAPTRDPDGGEELPVKLSERLRRDRLLRLKFAWGGRAERKIPRLPRQARVYTCLGLSACHHFIGGEVAFQPERDEVRLHRGEALSAPALSTLSLVPKENQPWRVQDEGERLARGVLQPRVSQFDLDSPELDIWHKIHSTTTAVADSTKDRRDATYDTKVLRLKNFGAGGLCLECDGQCKVQTRVGELIAYRSEADSESEWRIGTLRWLRCETADALELGVMRTAEEAVAVAVRASAGVGAGGEYFRALIAYNGSDPVVESLIVPAAMYDIGSILVLNSGTALRYVCLTLLIATSTSFSQFGFADALPPDSELEKIASIKNVRA